MITHPELVKALLKPGDAILGSLTPGKCTLLHMSAKLCSEAGELMDATSKYIFYEKQLDLANVIEELGDIEYYLEGYRQELGITRDECLEANIKKLTTRYPKLRFTNEDAHARANKTVH